MISVLLAIEDVAVGGELVEGLEAVGHSVSWVGPLDASPDVRRGQGRRFDVVIVDGDATGLELAVLGAAWQRVDPPPALVVLASTAPARIAAERIRATVVAKPVVAATLAEEVTRAAAAPRGATAPTAVSALRVLGMAAGGLPEDEAATIIAGSRQVNVGIVREALRPHMNEYVTATPLVDAMIARRAVTDAEARFALALDGARTVRGVIDSGGMDQLAAARLTWALVSGAVALLTAEPPEDDAHPAARLVATMRDHLRARRARLEKATAYQVLEVDQDAQPADVERAALMLSTRFAPEKLAGLDLGDLGALVDPLWQQVLRARAILVDPQARQSYDARRLTLEPDADAQRMRRRIDAAEAEAAFVRGQRALAAGDAFKAVSELASAARRLPDEPDYEVYAAWARCCANEARGADRRDSARHERAVAEAALSGRRPRPRALFALGLLCESAGDLTFARQHLRDALACDPRLAPARQALARLGG